MRITNKEVRNVVGVIDDIIAEYKDESVVKKRDWRTYEQRVSRRLRFAFNELKSLVKEAVGSLNVVKGETRGAKSVLSLEQKVLALLLKHLIGKSNRDMSLMLIIFSWLSDIDVSYKTIERLYSDQEVVLVLHNLHVLMLKKKGVKNVDCGGDGTGYGLSIKKHYASEAQKLKERMKDSKTQNKKSNSKKRNKKALFTYSFALIDIKTRMYIAFGSSMKSEKQAFLDAIKMLQDINIKIESLRLDRYYQKSHIKFLQQKIGNTKFFIIPKKNTTIKGSWEWKRMLHAFIKNTKSYLKEYFQRNQSESGFSEDKKRTGWKLGQKRPDRIHTANILTGLWHNLYWLAD